MKKVINGIKHTAEAVVQNDSSVIVSIKKANTATAVFTCKYMCSVEGALTLAFHQYKQQCLK